MSTNNNSYAQNNYNQAKQQLTFDQLINQLKAITEKQEQSQMLLISIFQILGIEDKMQIIYDKVKSGENANQTEGVFIINGSINQLKIAYEELDKTSKNQKFKIETLEGQINDKTKIIKELEETNQSLLTAQTKNNERFQMLEALIKSVAETIYKPQEKDTSIGEKKIISDVKLDKESSEQEILCRPKAIVKKTPNIPNANEKTTNPNNEFFEQPKFIFENAIPNQEKVAINFFNNQKSTQGANMITEDKSSNFGLSNAVNNTQMITEDKPKSNTLFDFMSYKNTDETWSNNNDMSRRESNNNKSLLAQTNSLNSTTANQIPYPTGRPMSTETIPS